MPIDDDVERRDRANRNLNRVKARRRSKVKPTSLRAGYSETREQIANRVQHAAGEALAALQRRQRQSSSETDSGDRHPEKGRDETAPEAGLPTRSRGTYSQD